MAEDFVPRPKARLPDGGRMSGTKDFSPKITPLKERPEIPFRPKPEPVPEPDGFTPEQLAAQLKAEAIRKLGDTDYVVTKAVEQARTLSQGWLAWRDTLRAIANGSGEPIPQEPDRWSSAEPTEPEHHFADLMLADETLDDAKARLSQRLRELRHYLIAPEIKVNEDGSVGLTAGEQSELQDLERRQTLGRWLDA